MPTDLPYSNIPLRVSFPAPASTAPVSLAAALAFLGAILRPALDYATNESILSIMSLDISMSWRAAAMPVC